MKKINSKKGFTLIEILVVIGIIAILAAVVLVAINPARQFAQANNSQRSANINTLLNAVGQRLSDTKGLWTAVTGCAAPTAGTEYTIGAGSHSAIAPATSLIDMSCLTPTYIAAGLPVDPDGGVWTSATDYITNYNVVVDTAGRWTIKAPKAQLSQTISVTR